MINHNPRFMLIMSPSFILNSVGWMINISVSDIIMTERHYNGLIWELQSLGMWRVLNEFMFHF